MKSLPSFLSNGISQGLFHYVGCFLFCEVADGYFSTHLQPDEMLHGEFLPFLLTQ